MPNFEKEILSKSGVPDLEAAFTEACANVRPCMAGKVGIWSHAVVHHAARETGWYSLNNPHEFPENKIKEIFERNFFVACKIFVEGGRLYKLPADPVRTPEVADAAINTIRGILKSNKTNIDPRSDI